MKEGGAIILAVVLLLPPASCSGDAVCRCERETTLFGMQKRTRLEISVKLYLQHCSRTVQHKYWSVCSAFNRGLCPEPGRKGCFYKGQSGASDHCKYVSASDDSNVSFELCRVVLVCVSPITNADMVMFTRRDATRCMKRQYKSL